MGTGQGARGAAIADCCSMTCGCGCGDGFGCGDGANWFTRGLATRCAFMDTGGGAAGRVLLIPAGAMSANTDGSLAFSFIFGLSCGRVAMSSNAARDALMSKTLSPLLVLKCSFFAPRAGPFPLMDTGVVEAPCAGATGVLDTPPYPANNGGRGGAGARGVGEGHS